MRALCSLCLHVSSANTRRGGCTRAGHLFFEVERNPKAFVQRVQITAKSSPPSDPHLGDSNPALLASPQGWVLVFFPHFFFFFQIQSSHLSVADSCWKQNSCPLEPGGFCCFLCFLFSFFFPYICMINNAFKAPRAGNWSGIARTGSPKHYRGEHPKRQSKSLH